MSLIPWTERELVSLSLSVSPRSLATKNMSVVSHLCGVPLISGLLRVRIQDRSISCLPFLVQLSHVIAVLGLSLRFWLMADTCNISIQASLGRFKSNENLPTIHQTISIFPLLDRVNL